MRCCRKFLLLSVSFLLTLSLGAYAQTSEDEDVSRLLDIREQDQLVMYGEYVEVEISSKKDVELSLINEVKPFGLEIEMVDSKTAILYGQVEFQDKLCFLVTAKVKRGNVTAERLCLYSEENENIDYPQISTNRYLEEVKTNQYTSITVSVEDQGVAVNTSVIGQLPVGLSVSSTNGNEVVLTGTINEAGMHEIVVKAAEANSEVVTFKQFVIEVTEQDRTYQCAPGYYWDDYLNYCVQADGRTCGPGTFWDATTQRCMAYNTHRSCRIGTYYDHYLGRCVRSGAQRCPLNYEWDGYYNRCVRLPYTCSFSQRYDYRLQRCVSIFRTRTCSIGTWWNSYRRSCLRNISTCSSGRYWNGRRCESHVRTCSVGRYFDPSRRRCVSRSINRTCRIGSTWDYGRGNCHRRPVIVNRTCRNGSRWSSRNRSCVRHDDGRINRRPHRPHRPTTRPNRPNRPDRPTTRPNRPRPDRPTTRPNRPRPDRPTTRPNRPNRPDRPTTRPNRPTRPDRPSTRPNRPNRPTRPDRPRRNRNG